MNYLAAGMPDIERFKVKVHGSGSMHHVYTRAENTGKFAAASLDLERWPRPSQVRNDRQKLNNVILIAEEVRGTL